VFPGVELPEFPVEQDGGVFTARFSIVPSDSGIGVIRESLIQIEQLVVSNFLQADDAGVLVEQVGADPVLSLLPVPGPFVSGGVLADVVGDDIERCFLSDEAGVSQEQNYKGPYHDAASLCQNGPCWEFPFQADPVAALRKSIEVAPGREALALDILYSCRTFARR